MLLTVQLRFKKDTPIRRFDGQLHNQVAKAGTTQLAVLVALQRPTVQGKFYKIGRHVGIPAGNMDGVEVIHLNQ